MKNIYYFFRSATEKKFYYVWKIALAYIIYSFIGKHFYFVMKTENRILRIIDRSYIDNSTSNFLYILGIL